MLRHLSINTEKAYIHWLGRYGSFLRAQSSAKFLTTERKLEAFLTSLAVAGVSGSTQNQAFNALLFFYREVLKQELGPVSSLRIAEQDRRRGIPVALPGLLSKKYPWAAHAERWAWVFPSHTTCWDRRTRTQVRWRCHEANVQRAVRAAGRTCNLTGLTPHYLRHAFATHALQAGAFVRDLQVVLGHNHLETTMLYLHAEAGRVVSPLSSYAGVPHQ